MLIYSYQEQENVNAISRREAPGFLDKAEAGISEEVHCLFRKNFRNTILRMRSQGAGKMEKFRSGIPTSINLARPNLMYSRPSAILRKLPLRLYIGPGLYRIYHNKTNPLAKSQTDASPGVETIQGRKITPKGGGVGENRTATPPRELKQDHSGTTRSVTCAVQI